MYDFEDLLARLSVTQTRLMLSHGMSTMLAHVSDQDESCPRVRILDTVRQVAYKNLGFLDLPTDPFCDI